MQENQNTVRQQPWYLKENHNIQSIYSPLQKKEKVMCMSNSSQFRWSGGKQTPFQKNYQVQHIVVLVVVPQSTATGLLNYNTMGTF